MTNIERRNYRIAIIVSVVFHGILFFIFFILEPKPVALEVYPVGMVEIAPETNFFPSHEPGNTGSPANRIKIPANPKSKPNHSNTGPVKPSSEKRLLNQKTNDTISWEKSQTSPLLEDKPVVEPKTDSSQKMPDGPGGNHKNDGTGPPVEEPISFGSGEAMVTRLGPPPSYPKNAVNEGKEGEVTVRILVHAGGNLNKVLLMNSSGDSRLDKTTLNSITRNWLFRPAAKDYYIDLVYVFNLKAGVTVRFIRSETGQ